MKSHYTTTARIHTIGPLDTHRFLSRLSIWFIAHVLYITTLCLTDTNVNLRRPVRGSHFRYVYTSERNLGLVLMRVPFKSIKVINLGKIYITLLEMDTLLTRIIFFFFYMFKMCLLNFIIYYFIRWQSVIGRSVGNDKRSNIRTSQARFLSRTADLLNHRIIIERA